VSVLLRALAPGLSDKDIALVFKKIDSDQSGSLSLQEVTNALAVHSTPDGSITHSKVKAQKLIEYLKDVIKRNHL
jgi:hypothetical protein